jgi:hypothetical protein
MSEIVANYIYDTFGHLSGTALDGRIKIYLQEQGQENEFSENLCSEVSQLLDKKKTKEE